MVERAAQLANPEKGLPEDKRLQAVSETCNVAAPVGFHLVRIPKRTCVPHIGLIGEVIHVEKQQNFLIDDGLKVVTNR